MPIRMSGWAASRETTHLLPGSSKRPDIRAHIAGHCVLFDVRTCTMTSGMGPAGLSHCAATPGHAAACGATAKHKAWDAPCQEMGYDFVALPIETGGRQPEEAEQFLDRLVKYAGSGDSSDEARFRHFAATSLMMTNQIGVARKILANLPITRHSQDRGRPLLGYVPLAPHRAHRVRRDPEPETPPESPESTTNNTP